MTDWADEIGRDICGPLPHANYVAAALRAERAATWERARKKAAEIADAKRYSWEVDQVYPAILSMKDE